MTRFFCRSAGVHAGPFYPARNGEPLSVLRKRHEIVVCKLHAIVGCEGHELVMCERHELVGASRRVETSVVARYI